MKSNRLPGRSSSASPNDAAHNGTSSRTLVVGRGISVQGTIQDAERLVVEGTVEANMIHANELIVTHGGMFRGNIEVDNAELAGTIDGTLTVRNSLTVQTSGRLIGKAQCRRLQVEDGGQVTGQLEMITTPLGEGGSKQQTSSAAVSSAGGNAAQPASSHGHGSSAQNKTGHSTP